MCRVLSTSEPDPFPTGCLFCLFNWAGSGSSTQMGSSLPPAVPLSSAPLGVLLESCRRGLGQPGVRGAHGAPLSDPAPCQTQHPAPPSITTLLSTSTPASWPQHPSHTGNWDRMGCTGNCKASFLESLNTDCLRLGFHLQQGFGGKYRRGGFGCGLCLHPATQGWQWRLRSSCSSQDSSPGWSYQSPKGAPQEAAPLVDLAPEITV